MLLLGLMSYKECLITCFNCTCYIFYEVRNESVGKSIVCNDDNKWFWDVVTQVLLKVFATDVIH